MSKNNRKNSPIPLYLFSVFFCALIGVAAFLLYQKSLTPSEYYGLPTVPCINDYRPIIKTFTISLSIVAGNTQIPIDARLGYDHGSCRRAIHTDDASGKIIIMYNDEQKFTLKNFFDVWHKTFTQTQFMSYQITQAHKLHVFVNGYEVQDYLNLILQPNQKINLIYN